MLSKHMIDYIDALPERVSKKSVLAKRIAKEYETYRKKDDTLLSDAAALYCLGTQFISERILEKPDKLTDTERSIVDLIPYFSYQIIKNDKEISDDVKSMCLYYHSDNPSFIKEDIIAQDTIPSITEAAKQRKSELYTIDVFISMTSKRAYREAFPASKALSILKEDDQASKDVLEYLKVFYG